MASTDTGTLPAGTTPEADPRRWVVLGVMCLSLLLIVVDNTIVNVALPTLQRDLDAGTSELQWIVDSYILVFAGLLLTMGALGDRFGRRGALSIGLSIIGLASIASAWVDSASWLIGTRAVMGIGGALVMPATLSIITNVFHDRRERAQAIAIWSASAGMAVAIGPVSGGWLIEHFWWGSVFLVNVPVVVLALVLGKLFVPTSRDPEASRLDIPGAVLSILGLVALVWAIIEGPHGWTDPKVVAGFTAAVVLLGAFVLWERRTPKPMLDMSLFRNPRFSAASGAIALTFFAMFGSLFLLTQFMQSVLGYSALEAGVRLVPMAAVQMVIAPLSAKVVERVGSKVIVGLGLSTAALGLVMASRLTPEATYPQVLVALVVLSAGLALVMPTATESIMGSLPPAKAGVGSAVNDTTRELGGALGVAVLGSVMSSTYRPEVADAISGTPIPAEVADVVTDQVGAAMNVASTIGGERGAQLADVASHAFAQGMGTAFLIGAGALAVGAVIVALFLPARAVDHDGPVPADPDEGPTGGTGPEDAPVVDAATDGAPPVAASASASATASAGPGEPVDGAPPGAPVPTSSA